MSALEADVRAAQDRCGWSDATLLELILSRATDAGAATAIQRIVRRQEHEERLPYQPGTLRRID